MPLSESDLALIEVLASTDVLFLPLRDSTAAYSPVVYQHRRRFPAFGVTWYRPGGTSATRKSTERLRSRLSREGLVRLIRRPSERSVGLALSDAGDAKARALCGLPQLADALAT